MTKLESAICLAQQIFLKAISAEKNKDRQEEVRLFSCALKNAQLSHSSGTFYSRLPGDYELMNWIFLVAHHH